MAITPTDVRRLGRPDPQIIKDLEARIDKTLIEAHRAGAPAVFQAKELANKTLRDVLISNYGAAGWEVKYTNSNPDGQYLRFKEYVRSSSSYD